MERVERHGGGPGVRQGQPSAPQRAVFGCRTAEARKCASCLARPQIMAVGWAQYDFGARPFSVDDSDVEVGGVRWGVGGGVAQNLAKEGFSTVVTTRRGQCRTASAAIREAGRRLRDRGGSTQYRGIDRERLRLTVRRGGRPEVLVYNAGYLEGRDLPSERAARTCSGRDVRHDAHIGRGPFSSPGSVAGDAQEGPGSFSSPTTPAPCAARSG